MNLNTNSLYAFCQASSQYLLHFFNIAYSNSFPSCVAVLVFFFFQAEDGIRDSSVTGVQTCALPIYCLWLVRRTPRTSQRQLQQLQHNRKQHSQRTPPVERLRERELRTGTTAAATERSEERRVGKEGRSRWSPYH